MRNYILHTLGLLLILCTFGASATTVFIDPATLDSPGVGSTLTIAVKVKDVSDLVAYQFELSFDKTALKLNSAEEGGFLKSDGARSLPLVATTTSKSVALTDINAEVLQDINSTGIIIIANLRFGNNVKGVDGDGDLAIIKFEILEAKASKIELKHAFESAELNPILVNSKTEPIKADLAGSIISFSPVCVKGDVNNDGNIRSNDAILALRIAAELMVPTPQQECAADMNENGKVQANDAILILRKAAGLGAPGKESPIAREIANVILNEAYGISGEKVSVPLKIDNIYGIAGGDIRIGYDSNVLRPIDISSKANVLLASNVKNPGDIHIVFASSENMLDEDLAVINFEVISDNISPLTLKKVELYGNDSILINSTKIDGYFSSYAIPPKDSALLQNFPNPFNPDTWMPYQLKNDSDVIIRIYTVAGDLVRELDLGYKAAGIYLSKDRAAYWDGKDKFGTSVSSGIYFYSIKARDFSEVRKMIILK